MKNENRLQLNVYKKEKELKKKFTALKAESGVQIFTFYGIEKEEKLERFMLHTTMVN